MKKSTLQALGGIQSILFCIGIYLVALCFSIFVCSSVYHAFKMQQQETMAMESKTSAPVLASVQ